MEQKNIRRGEVIFREGDPSGCMYQVVKGRVGIYAGYEQPGQRQLNLLSMGDSFGEMAMLDGRPRSATAVAEEDTSLTVITMDSLAEYFTQDPKKVLAIVEKMSGNLRQLTKKYMDACRVLAEAEEADEAGTARSAETLAGIRRYSSEYRSRMER